MVAKGLLGGKTIVISGGTKGVGRELTFACLKEGANVVFGGRDEDAGIEIEKATSSHNVDSSAKFVYMDLRKAEDCKKLFSVALDSFGSIDGFVNYAGVTSAASLLDTPVELFDDVMSVNIRAAFLCCQHACNMMIENGGGSIILVNSCHASRGEKDRAAYACSKGALSTLGEHIAYHYAINQIRCNTLVMGWSPTEGELSLRKSQGISEEELRSSASKVIPMGRMQETSDYIPGLLYLLSDYSAQVTGTNLRITGGLYL